MIPGISSFAFGWGVQLKSSRMDETALVNFAVAHGVSVVQLGDNLPLHQLSAERRSALIKLAQDSNVRLEIGARGLTESHLKTYLELCREMGVSLLRFVIDTPDYNPLLSDVTTLLRGSVADLASCGVTLAIENHDRFKAVALRRLIDDVASPHVGICFDTANSLGAGEGLDHISTLLAPVTVNLHVKDVTIRRLYHQMGFIISGCTLGDGCLPIPSLLDRMQGIGYRGSVILESWWPPDVTDDETVSGERASAEKGLSTLKHWLRS